MQQALLVQSPKAPFILRSTEVPSPVKGEVLVRIMSAGLNPANFKQREYDVVIPEYPAVLGDDVAGVIEELGPSVEGWKKGDRVFAQTLGGGFQQFTTIPAETLIPVVTLIQIPENTTFDEVATFPIAFTTAAVGLFAPAPIGLSLNPTFSWDKPLQGESALVIGGASSVGQFAIQLFKFLGFTRIVAYASKVHFDHLKRLGATECIDRGATPLDSLAAHSSFTSPVKVVFDVGFESSLNVAYDCALDGGSIVTSNPYSQLERNLDQKKVTLVHVWGYMVGPDVRKYDNVPGYCATLDHTKFGKLIIKNLPQMLEKGVISGNPYEVLPNGVAGILGGLERLEEGSVRGIKLVAHPQDPMV
ncbi:chaperonin 10-like protein [Mycena polygramma]|nr:chaperonin 10-like protein [Mycena polygramma]